MITRILPYALTVVSLVCCERYESVETIPLALVITADGAGQVFEVDSIRFSESIRLEDGVEGIIVRLLPEDVIRFREFTETNRRNKISIAVGDQIVSSMVLAQEIEDGVVIFRSDQHEFVVRQLKAIEGGNPAANEAMRDLLDVVR